MNCNDWIDHCEEKDKLTREQKSFLNAKRLVKKVNEDTHCKDITELLNFMFEIVGSDKTYQDYRKMSDEEKESFKRDIKIKHILK